MKYYKTIVGIDILKESFKHISYDGCNWALQLLHVSLNFNSLFK